jgi:glucosylceramidase
VSVYEIRKQARLGWLCAVALLAAPASAVAQSPVSVEVVQTTATLTERMQTLPSAQFLGAGPPCTSARLRVTRGATQRTAERYSQLLVLTNTGAAACTLRGYPALRLLGARRLPVHVPVRHGGGYRFVDHGPQPVTLAPAATASFAFGGPSLSAPGQPRCERASLSVTPPGGRTPISVSGAVPACAAGLRLSAIGAGPASPLTGAAAPVIRVDPQTRYQAIAGFGAALTDTSAWLIHYGLPPMWSAGLTDDLYTANGIDLDFVLAPIGGSDFNVTEEPYTYDDMPPGESDPTLAHFSIVHDAPYILPSLRQILAANPLTQVFATSWSPPVWMKANGAFNDTNRAGWLNSWDYGVFANYVVRFLQAYARAGVPVSAIAPENEPDSAAPFPSMSFPEPSESAWIRQDLEPALRGAGLHPRVYGYDSGWELPAYPEALVADAPGALSGIAWHCYNGTPNAMSALDSLAPELDEVVAECSPGITRYALPKSIIASLRNWASTMILWNLALDPFGGPVQAPNAGCQNCSGLVTIDPSAQTLTFDAPYFELGQFSRFIEPGAVRIDSDHFDVYPGAGQPAPPTARLDDVAALNPDGSIVLVAYNDATTPTQFTVDWEARSFSYTLPAKATVTFVWR